MSSEIKIIATTVEKFNEVKRALDTLPIQTLNRIESAEYNSMVGIICVIKGKFLGADTLYFPNNVLTILPSERDEIRIVCKDFTFVLGENFKNTKITYKFI